MYKIIYTLFCLIIFISSSMAEETFVSLKKILNIGKNLNGYILIIDLLNLNFRKVKFNKRKKCKCS